MAAKATTSIRCTLLAALLFSAPSLGKNLDGRFGFGLSFLGFTSSSAVSLKYFHNKVLATNFLVGFNTEANTYLFGAKSLSHVLFEENMNLFVGIGGFLLSTQDSLGTTTGFEFDAIFGGEFFLGGLPNLAFAFEIGIGMRSLRTTSFRAVGGGFASGGIHYYF